MKLSVAVIGLNVADKIGRLVKSLDGICDEFVYLDSGSTDDSLAVVKKLVPGAITDTYIDPNRHPMYGWTSDFSVLRNKAFALCTGDVILWVDADDAVINAQGMKKLIQHCMFDLQEPCHVLNCRYDYSHDRYGNCTVRQTRYRVIKRGVAEWEYPVHEDIKPTRPIKLGECGRADSWVEHAREDTEHDGRSAMRNLWIMEQYVARGGKMNDRLWQNIGSSHAILQNFEPAIEAFNRSLAEKAGNTETDYISLIRLGDCYRSSGRFEEAKMAMAQAMILFPDRSLSYMALAEFSNATGEPDKALLWATLGEKVGGDDQALVWNPTTTKAVPTQVRAVAAVQQNDLPLARKYYRELHAMYPDDKEIKTCLDGLDEVINGHALSEAWLAVHRSLAGKPVAQATLVAAVPPVLKTYAEIAKLTLPPRPPEKPWLAIYCGPSMQPWGPGSLKGGVGGSEEAVIFQSRELAKLGYHVEVYAFPSPEEIGTDSHGVVWMPYNALDEAAKPDVYVSWRQFRGDPRCHKAGQRWLWLHDVIHGQWFTPEFVAEWTGIFCLTTWHASALPDFARAKVVLTKNGLDPTFLVHGKNAPNRFIYASSPDRGLEQLLELWPQIRLEIPDATLDIFYGYTRMYLQEMQTQPKLRLLKQKIDAGIKQPGIFWRGMVGQKELAKAFSESGFWLYPTSWPETSCITSMKAQALGAIPITSRYMDSGVPETTVYDLGPTARQGRIELDADWQQDWVKAVIAAHARTDLDEYRKTMKAWARDTFSWRKVAQQWDSEFTARSSGTSTSQPTKENPVLTLVP